MEERRPTLLNFDPKREPTAPRDAATVIVLREVSGESGPDLEVFCVLRHGKSSFLGGAVVFPGGKLDPSDVAAAWLDRVTAPHSRGTTLTDGDADLARALAIAACRESLEEAGLVPLAGAATDVEQLRRDLTGEGGLLGALARRALRLDLAALVPWARWITPEAEARRFDARFYLLALPEGQVGRHDEHETTHSFWASPREVLARFERGEIFLAPPTTRTLELLAGVHDFASAIELASRQTLAPICPVFGTFDEPGAESGIYFLSLPGDPAHPVVDRRVAGTTRFVLRDGRFVSEGAPVRDGAGADDSGEGPNGTSL